MYNHYGERPLQYAEVDIALLDGWVRQGAAHHASTTIAGIPADAVLLDVQLRQHEADVLESFGVVLIYTHPDWPVVLAGDQIPAISIYVMVQSTAPATDVPPTPVE